MSITFYCVLSIVRINMIVVYYTIMIFVDPTPGPLGRVRASPQHGGECAEPWRVLSLLSLLVLSLYYCYTASFLVQGSTKSLTFLRIRRCSVVCYLFINMFYRDFTSSWILVLYAQPVFIPRICRTQWSTHL